MQKPRVSICIPTYNREKLVVKAVQSALRQTYDNLEILIADDASSDNTVETIKAIGDRRIRVETRKLNIGMVDNWNFCLRQARGEYIKFCNSDDQLMPSCVSKMVQAAQECRVGFVACNSKVIYTKTKIRRVVSNTRYSGLKKGDSLVKRFIQNRRNTIGEPSSVMFATELIKKAGFFDPKIKHIVDAEYWTRILMHTDAYFFKTPLCKLLAHEEAHSSNAAKQGWPIDDAFYVTDKYSKGPYKELMTKSRSKLRYEITVSVQRQIKQAYRRKRRKYAQLLYRRLQANLTPFEQITFLVRHGIEYWGRRLIRIAR